MNYTENPKTKGSGVMCVIPQTGICPVKCADCFFQSGRSYLEPLDENLPNMLTPEQALGKIVRVNDGNDSNNKRSMVIEATRCYPERFYNTSIPNSLEEFEAPVVLTVNPGHMTNTEAHLVDPVSSNLMFVRFRTNSWNLKLGKTVIEHYTSQGIPVVLTFMAYYTDTVPSDYKDDYTFRKRTMNSYWVITPKAWDRIANELGANENPLVHTCGKDAMTFSCKHCGTCLREYYSTKCRIEENEQS